MRAFEDKTVLVVEDEPIVAMHTEDLLTDLGFKTVVVAGGVDRAFDALSATSVGVAVLDINLNGEKSFPIAEHLVQRSIPFLFATGYSDQETPFPHAVMINKPFNSEALESGMRTILLT
ncbi:hypothetical protein A3736_09275 [Erythrobacter sp. HI0063]|jgi:CheY-like chemotaxis protein|uniref:response regulator n=1 Tax=Erythrobacter sp. HI0063 TaxID=1822240 RepID=UPI0007C38433|nr:response regulator [Erythrobacter sp. HI0063]KZY56078.1 hypothetical protein A3736_09275 [Erythrobacter sp. HI0063]